MGIRDKNISTKALDPDILPFLHDILFMVLSHASWDPLLLTVIKFHLRNK